MDRTMKTDEIWRDIYRSWLRQIFSSFSQNGLKGALKSMILNHTDSTGIKFLGCKIQV